MNTEEILWKYIDGNSTPDEAKDIEKLIATNSEIQSLYNSLLKIDGELSKALQYSAPHNFTRSVIADNYRYQIRTKPASFKFIPVVLTVLLALIGLSIYFPDSRADYTQFFNFIEIPELSQVYIISGFVALTGCALLWIDSAFNQYKHQKMLRV